MNEAPRFESGVKESEGGENGSGGGGGGFGEMLLLIAIHFHGNQMTAISDLVCATLGMKVPVRSNRLATWIRRASLLMLSISFHVLNVK